MSFTFDLNKSRSNKVKHGIDFVRAQRLWEDPKRMEARVKSGDEDRSLIVGKVDDKLWTAIVTYREDVIRIISVRRARQDEVKRYEG
jgi:uncharacterized protein